MKSYIFLAFFIIGLVNGVADVLADSGNWDLGRSIFEQGEGRDGREIGGRIHGGLMLRGAAVACSSCHGLDARGGGEAFIDAPDIRWLTLSKPYAPRSAGQTRPPYDLSLFSKAIHQGVNSAERELDPGMPRFDLSQDEVEGLVAYLSKPNTSTLASKKLPVVLGLMPSSKSSKFAQEVIERLLACPKQGESSRFPPVEILYYDHPNDAIDQVTTRLAKGDVSYILAPYIAGWEDRYLKASKDWPVVTLLPITPLSVPIHPSIGFQFPGVTSQIEALINQYLGSGEKKLSILTTGQELLTDELTQFASAESKKRNIQSEIISFSPPTAISKNEIWLVLSPIQKIAKLITAQEHKEKITILIPAMFFDPAFVEIFGTKFPQVEWIVAYPYNPYREEKGMWRSPSAAWSGAACTLLTHLAENPNQEWLNDDDPITSNDGLMLSNTLDEIGLRDQVVILKWPQGHPPD